MRIIAGEFRGRKLLPPEGDVTRPITDRVKQSVFDILAPEIEGAMVYDLFAGTGSMGLECLSRGAKQVTFFEADRSAIGRLKNNITTLGVDERAQVIAGDLFRGFAGAPTGEAAKLIFLDPPYRFLRDRPDDLRKLASHLAKRLASDGRGGMVIFRHDANDELSLPDLLVSDRREYGSMTIELLLRRS